MDKMFSTKLSIILTAFAVCQGHQLSGKKSPRESIKIVDGINAKSGQFPHQAAIPPINTDGVCGGVILNEKWILTGIACLRYSKNVIVGALDLDAENDEKQVLEIDDVFPFPDTDEEGLGPNDIGLIKLQTEITFNDNIQPAKLPIPGQEFDGTADASGYTNNVLKAALNVSLITFEQCDYVMSEVLSIFNILDEQSNICTGAEDQKSYSCLDDIGGPLTQNGIVIGTATWYVKPCGTKGMPNVYTKVSNFVDWITQTITNNS